MRKILKSREKIFKFSAVFMLIAVLGFSSLGPGVLNYFGVEKLAENLKIKEAYAAVAYRATGAETPGTAGVTVPFPTGVAANDIVILVAGTIAGGSISITAAGSITTWTEITTGGLNVASGEKLYVWWGRYSSGTTGPTVTPGSDHIEAATIAYSGVVTSGSPIDVSATGTETTSDTTLSFATGISTTVSNTIALLVTSNGTDTNTNGQYSAEANTSLTSVVERMDYNTNSGGGGGIMVTEGVKAAAGAVGTWTATLGTASTKAYISFALKPQNTTTLGDGTNPGNASIGPGGAITDLDAFTLITDNGSDTVNSLTVTLGPAGAYNNIAQVDVTDNSNTVKCSVSSLTSDTLNFSTCGLSATTVSTIYKVRVTPKSHANMPVPPGASYDTTGTVTSWTSVNGNTQAGSDSASATVTIDNLSPSGATSVSGSSGDAQVTLNWTTSASSDFSRSVMLRWTGSSAGSEVPAEGTDYANGNAISTATVVCVRAADGASAAVSGVDGAGTGGCSGTALTNSQAYTYKVFQKDSRGNYDIGVAMGTFTPSPAPVTTISNFVTGEPSNSTIAPAASGLVDSFGLQTNTGADTVTGATVTLAAGTGARVATVAIVNNGDTFTYCSVAPSGDTAALTSCGIPVNTTNTQFKIKITAISHASMPAPPGGSYAVTGAITSFTSTNSQAGSDSASATVTIDNASPANVTGASGTAGNAQVTLIWTNPADSDYNSAVALRSTSAVSNVPAEGTTYAAGNTIGAATVACVVTSPTASCTDSGLSNGTAYHYKIFSKDTNGNYATGTVPTGSPLTPSLATFTITSSAGSGGAISPLGVTNVAQGSSQTYTMTPNLGYDVATITVDGSPEAATSTSYTFGNVQQNHTIAVTFVMVTPTYTITSTAGENGTISPLGATILLQGASQTYTITPISGYDVDTLTVDGSSEATSTSYTFTNVQANHTIAVTFALIPPPPGTFAITATAGANGTISPSGVTIVTQGASQAYTITPDSGYDVSTLTVDGSSEAISTSYTFTNVQANHTIETTFAALPEGAVPVVGLGGLVRPTRIIFSGKAFPGGKISVIDKQLNIEKIIKQEEIVKEDGSFSISFTGVLQATHSFGIIAKDKTGRVSQSKFFFINTVSDDFVVKDILVPPTIALLTGQVTRGVNATVVGSATPGYIAYIELDGILIQDSVSVGGDGTYKFEIPTGALEFGSHTLKAKQLSSAEEKESDFSISRTFTVSRLAVIRADLNDDGKIDIRDWSIFLSLWGSKGVANRDRIDFNKDGKINIADFSIFVKNIRKK